MAENSVTSRALSEPQLRLAGELILGKKLSVIATEMGLAYQTLWRWKREPDFIAYMDELREDASQQAKAIIAGELVNSTEEVIRLRNTAIAERIRLDAAKDLLDRGGLKAIDRVEQRVQHSLSPELVRMVQSVMAESSRIPKVTVIETSQLPERAGVSDG